MDFSGASAIPPSRTCVLPWKFWKTRSAGSGPPPQPKPPGVAPQGSPAAFRAAAALPADAALQVMVAKLPDWPGKLTEASTGLRIFEYSPRFAKRKEVPQLPRTVAPTVSLISQVKATFGLRVIPDRFGFPP